MKPSKQSKGPGASRDIRLVSPGTCEARLLHGGSYLYLPTRQDFAQGVSLPVASDVAEYLRHVTVRVKGQDVPAFEVREVPVTPVRAGGAEASPAAADTLLPPESDPAGSEQHFGSEQHTHSADVPDAVRA